MNDERPDPLSMLIGLHELAARRGDGLMPELPELYDLMAERRRYRDANVIEFPAWEARRPGTVATGFERRAPAGIIPFPSLPASAKKRKDTA